MTQIFKCLAGSRLYGTNNANSDHDYKAVHLPMKRQILLGKRDFIINKSTGSKGSRNGADDVDMESFELQRFLKLASDMQTIPVEMLFIPDGYRKDAKDDYFVDYEFGGIWSRICSNRDKILSRNTKAFVGYCKGQAVKYSMRGKRLDTFIKVLDILEYADDQTVVEDIRDLLTPIEGVTFIDREQPGGRIIPYLDVYGRQVPGTLRAGAAATVYAKPVREAGNRASAARDAGGMDCKALYHAVRIADEGVSLFTTGKIEFPCQNLELLGKIRAGDVEIDQVLDIFDERIAVLEQIGDNSPLAEAPDIEWINDFVSEVYEKIVKAK